MLLFRNFSFGQCSSDLYDMETEVYLCQGVNYGLIGPYAGSQSGWTYSWSPSTNLSDPTLCNPNITVSSGMDITYTLTITAPCSGQFVAGTVRVHGIQTPSISPIGPITYYYWYEGTQYLVLTSDQPNNNWYKNGSSESNIVKSESENGNTYTIALTGANNGTDYYKVDNGVGCTAFSNIIAVTYHGVTSSSGYPVTIYNQYYVYGSCGPTLPATITQPNPGSSPTYSWTLFGGNEAYWSITNQSGNSATLNNSGGTPPTAEGILARAVAADGTEIDMNYGVGYFTQSNCTPRARFSNPIEENGLSNKTFLAPNPSNDQVTIRSKNLMQRVEIYNSLGGLVKNVLVNGVNTITVNTSKLESGLYSIRIVSTKGIEVLKLVIQR